MDEPAPAAQSPATRRRSRVVPLLITGTTLATVVTLGSSGCRRQTVASNRNGANGDWGDDASPSPSASGSASTTSSSHSGFSHVIIVGGSTGASSRSGSSGATSSGGFGSTGSSFSSSGGGHGSGS